MNMPRRILHRSLGIGLLEAAFSAPFFFLPLAAGAVVGVYPRAIEYAQAFCGAFAVAVLGAYINRYYIGARISAFIILGLGSFVAIGIAYAGLGIEGSANEWVLLAILNTDATESAEFLEVTHAIPAYVIEALLLVPLFALALQWRRGLVWRLNSRTPAIILGALSVLYFVLRVGVLGHPFMVALRNLPPPLGIYFSTIAAVKERTHVAAIGSNTSPIPNITVANPREPVTYVVVIGEAESKYHMHLYGYDRPTTPHVDAMAKSGELVVFEDAVTSHAHTVPALTEALTVSIRPQKQTHTIIDVLNTAGFKTLWLSNQASKDGWDLAVALLTASASEHRWVRNLEKFQLRDSDPGYQLDAALLPYLSDALAHNDERKVVFIHLIGNHRDYRRRYPPEAKIFSNFSSACLDAEEADIIDSYDNSVRYTDFILNQIIDMTRNAGGESLVLYFSDHGDEVYEFRKFLGHSDDLLSPYMAEVPLLMWMSPRYRLNHPELVAAAVASSTKAISTADLSYALADAAGVSFPGMDAHRSFLSRQFTIRPRTTANRDYATFKNDWRPDPAHANRIPINGCAKNTKRNPTDKIDALVGTVVDPHLHNPSSE
jgi:glucan phosphoethanolaminetransferase (alkaline phosphatase superfamily)